ncbi:Hypothetical predicted protein [Podarcis lilfordi]|uniref:Uncharacterized protein n=1 Tax=Podarcis lilfordi TaxID=74358 RepID=A0AA35PA20_9SAUR|nr:Hypothetical predicted protein [Podarcis lilfordi]
MEQLCACATPRTGERRVKGRRAGFLERTGKEGGPLPLLPLLPPDVPSGLAFAGRALVGLLSGEACGTPCPATLRCRSCLKGDGRKWASNTPYLFIKDKIKESK